MISCISQNLIQSGIEVTSVSLCSLVMEIENKNKLTQFLQFSTLLIFLGRAYQYFFFSAPYRTLFWDEGWMKPLVENILGMDWTEYATSPNTVQYIELLVDISGLFYLMAAVSTIFISNNNHLIFRLLIGIGIALLVFLALLIVKDKNLDYYQFFEMGIQMITPTALLLITSKKNVFTRNIISILRIAVAITFLPHGLFALGVPFVPGHFIDMTIGVLGVDEATAKAILFIAGIMDVLIAICIFIPKVSRYFLMYAFIWGILTALARLVGGWDMEQYASSVHNSLYLTIYRLPHGLIPLALLLFTTNHQHSPSPKPPVSI